MSYKFKIFNILILSLNFYFAQCDAFDISLGSFLTSKSIKCYKCSSLRNAGCKNITTSIGNEKLLEECTGKATGCVKQWIRTEEDKIIIYRDCYYGPINLIKNFDCKDRKNYGFSAQRCYKCRGDLCNSSNQLGPVSKNMIFFNSMVIFITTFILKF